MLSHRSCFFKGKSFSAAPTEMIPQLPLICFDARSAAAREVQWTSFTRGCPRSGRKGRSVARRPALWLAVREVHVGLCLSFIAGRINWDSCGICDYCTAEWLFCITAFILGAVFVHIHLLPEGSSLLSAGQLLQSYTFTNVALCVHSCFVFFITFLQSAANCWALSHNSFSHTQTGNDRNATVAARSATPPNTCLPALCQRHGAWWETGLTSEANQWIGGIKQKFLCPCCRFDLCQSRWGSSWWSAMSKICLIGLN